jgi:hypothetical protein
MPVAMAKGKQGKQLWGLAINCRKAGKRHFMATIAFVCWGGFSFLAVAVFYGEKEKPPQQTNAIVAIKWRLPALRQLIAKPHSCLPCLPLAMATGMAP